jgi:hypothetical protein
LIHDSEEVYLIPTFRKVPETGDGKEKNKDSEEGMPGSNNPLSFYVYAPN